MLRNCVAKTPTEHLTVFFPRLGVVIEHGPVECRQRESLRMETGLAVCKACLRDKTKMERVKRDLMGRMREFAARRGKNGKLVGDEVTIIWDSRGDQRLPPAPPPDTEMEITFGKSR